MGNRDHARSLNDLDADNAAVVDITFVNGIRTNTQVFGGAHWGDNGAFSNVHDGALVRFGQSVTFRLRSIGPDLACFGCGVVITNPWPNERGNKMPRYCVYDTETGQVVHLHETYNAADGTTLACTREEVLAVVDESLDKERLDILDVEYVLRPGARDYRVDPTTRTLITGEWLTFSEKLGLT
jgi:hypothetical protein